jgi:superfamily II DNA or RNA helicase
MLRAHAVTLDLVDERVAGTPLDLRFQGKLTPIQESAARALLAHSGVLVAPPGVGKTVIGTYLVASRACSTLVLVHRRPLLEHRSESSRPDRWWKAPADRASRCGDDPEPRAGRLGR